MRRYTVEASDLARLRAFGLPGAGSGLRASDAERERAAEALRRHHADGRLSTDELEERLERAYAGRTLADLDRLFADLPRLRAPDRERRARRRGPWPPVVAPVLAVLVAVALVTGAHALWLAWPLMIFLVVRSSRPGHAWHSAGRPGHGRRYGSRLY